MVNQNNTQKRKVAIIDDHPLVCEAISRAINQEPDLEVCGSGASVDEALGVIRQQQPDIVLVDLSLSQSSGFTLLVILRRDYPDLPAIVLSMHEEATHAVRAIQSGAKGYLMKKESLATIIQAIRQVLAGGVWLKDELFQQAAKPPKETQVDLYNIPELLTERELEIFEMIGQGISSETIAKKLFISKRTVESHRDHIKVKLNVSDIVRLYQLAFQWAREKL